MADGASRFVLIRHAESTWNASGRWQGQGDPPLSARGWRQAAELAEALVDEPIDVLFASDLRRAMETARVLARARGLEVQPDPRLRELHIGRWTGLGRAEIERTERSALDRFESEAPDERPGGGESRRELRERVRSTLAEISARCPGLRVGVVTHLGVVRALVPGTELSNADWRSTDPDDLAGSVQI